MEDGGGTDREKDMPNALLGHIDGLRRVEDALVKRRQTVDVLRQERDVVHAFDELHHTLLHDLA
jgi:hypothetical protein